MQAPRPTLGVRPARRPSSRIAVLLLGALLLAPASHGGDILRGGATVDRSRKNADARGRAGAEAADIAKTAARDRLARTTEAINAVRRMQQGAAVPTIAVPDGLTPGGLQRATGLNARWDGALDPVQNGNTVGIKQTKSQAILHWETFNVGRNTTLQFDQSEGKADAGKWIAFNKVFDPTGVPSQILGSIKAEGQVYILNQNGIIFGAGSQVNTRTLVASSIPINDNLVESGLLNNRDAQFLFSALEVPEGTEGTPAFTPPSPLTPDSRIGDVTVQAGAVLQSSVNNDGNGGRVMLVGANVTNDGHISTPSGQTIIASGLQVGVRAHDSGDPSLRGLDVWVGEVGTYGGNATNRGLIEAMTGSVLMVGREVNQSGVIDSSTSVNLNGRIDLLASYGAVGNPNFDRTAGSTIPPFLSQFTGVVSLGEGSVTRILPDYLSTKAIPGTSLPENSRVNIEGLAIQFGRDSIVQAPSGDVTVRAGTWPYRDLDGNRTTLDALGSEEDGLSLNFDGSSQVFLLSGGQISFDAGSVVDVSGSTDVFVALSQHLITVQLRGTELADSPLQRTGSLRGDSLVVDLRRTGSYNGREWVGTPLGDLTGLAGIVERNAAQLTARGGTVTVEAGDAILIQNDATIDVSGGYFRQEGGRIATSRLLRGRQVINIAEATPDVLYDGIYEGKLTQSSTKWGITRSYSHALAPLGGYTEQEYVEGAGGGTISLTAPSLALGGNLVGRTIKGPRQLEAPPQQGTLELTFRGERKISTSPSVFQIIQNSPIPPSIAFTNDQPRVSVPALALVKDKPVALGGSVRSDFLVDTSIYEDEGAGFGNLIIDNRDGDMLIPKGTKVTVPAGGSLVVRAANVFVEDDIIAPGGTVSLTAYNFSPYLFQELNATGLLINVPAPAPVDGRGIVSVGPGVLISVAGMVIDDRPTSPLAPVYGRQLDGGSITLEGYSVRLEEGSVLDASGGMWARPAKGYEYGTGGDISLLAGKDPDLDTTLGGELVLNGKVQAYSATVGGSLTVQANPIQIGGVATAGTGLLLQPDFFRRGGFTNYSLIGIGAQDANGSYLPALRVAAGTSIEPVSHNLVLTPHGQGRGQLTTRPMLKAAGLRPATSLSLTGIGVDDPFIPLNAVDRIEALGLVILEEGSRIVTDPGASVAIKGDMVAVLGSIEAPGGDIDISGGSSFKLSPTDAAGATFALPTVYLGSSARLSTAGTAVFLPDSFGRRSGIIYPGGNIRVSGNIVAEAGAVLDVSGATAMLDFHPTRLGSTETPLVPRNAGLNTMPWARRSVPLRVDSDGGRIELHGSQMLYSDATLLGHAGGPGALGGTLSISSGLFYPAGTDRTSAEINLVVEQMGSALAFGSVRRLGDIVELMSRESDLVAVFATGILDPAEITDPTDITNPAYFAVEKFADGGFDSLDLGFEYFASGNPVPSGGNIKFVGPVTINARGSVRLAAGGVIQAESPVTIKAPYVAIGQEFREPQNPDDQIFPFSASVAGQTGQYFFPPSFGLGSLNVSAQVIDIGTLSLQQIGNALFAADGGDIRGSGSLNIAGDLVLRAAQIYPTTLAAFDIYAYDHAGLPGSVTIIGSGVSAPPLSAGGSLNIFASEITQGGTLRAPLGSITLGWDGTDFDRSDADLDQPYNPVVGAARTVPTAQVVTLQSKSLTSVSAIDPSTGEGIVIPFGLSPDGVSWIDPRGVNVTVSGLPQKSVSIAGNSVVTEAGSSIDLRGGGDLLAYRWVPGTGGSADILGTATEAYISGQEYSSGDLVEFGGETYSARVDIDPADFVSPPDPSEGRYWTQLPESYAVVPGFNSGFAPVNSFNTGPNSGSLAGDPGYSTSGLRLGEQIYLQESSGLAAGYYTLLPRRYGILPGAALIIPQENQLVGSATPLSTTTPALGSSSIAISTATREEGSSYVSGFTYNSLNRTAQEPALRSRFEVVPSEVLTARAKYDSYSANAFLTEAAVRLDAEEVQHLPRDSGSLSFHGNNALSLNGSVQAKSIAGGRGARIDISSFADMFVVGGSGEAPAGSSVVLDAGLLNSWGAESLLIGGLRRNSPTGRVVDVRTSNLTLDNPGLTFFAPEIILASRERLTLTPRSSIASSDGMTRRADPLGVIGDGTLLRVSGDLKASISRGSLTGATTPLMIIGAGAEISGRSVILDSTYATKLDSTAVLTAEALTLGSGQISIVFDNASGNLTGSLVNPHLVLSGDILGKVQESVYLTLQSYRTIDIYGTGAFGSESLARLNLLGGGVRGYEQGTGTALFQVSEVLFNNPSNVSIAALASPPLSGELRFESNTVLLGSNDFRVAGYQSLVLDAGGGILAEGTGSFRTAGDLNMITPLITGAQGVRQGITADGALNLSGGSGQAVVAGGLGAALDFQGTTVNASSNIFLPSGALTLRATTGDLTVGGQLSVAGSAMLFYDLTRHADAGRIYLVSETGDVLLLPESAISVAAHADGGNAGILAIGSPGGIFDSDGLLTGNAGTDGTAGTFILDAGSIASFDDLSADLDQAGFFEERKLRVRTGDITISGATKVRKFALSTDAGSITVTGLVDASGETGGRIELAARNNLTLTPTAVLTVAAQRFSNAGKGGHIALGAGAAVNGVANTAALLDIQVGSTIDLSVAEYVAGDYTTPGSSAFHGQFQGTLHLRAPQNAAGTDLLIDAIDGQITGAASIMAEGYRLYDLTNFGGALDSTAQARILSDGQNFLGTAGTTTAGYTAMVNRLLANNAGLTSALVLAPGAEIINAASPANLNFNLNTVGSSITIPAAGGTITFPNGTPGNNMIRSSIAASITAADGTVTALAANTNTVLAPGSSVTLAAGGSVTFATGAGGAIPVGLTSGSTFTTGATGVAGTVSAQGSVITLNAVNTSSITLAAGTRIAFPTGTVGASRIRSNVAGTITSATGVVTVLAANTNTAIAAGSYVTLNAAGTITSTNVTGGAIAVALASGSFTTSGPTSVTPATGDLTLGTPTSLASADWDFSAYRFGARSAPGVLTLRAKGNLVFNNTLSDGFTPIAQGTAQNFADIGHSRMWLAPLQSIDPGLPVNTQSWSYHLAAGADLSGADFRSVLALSALQPGKGSLLVGQFYPAVPNTATFGAAAAIGGNGQTADSIRISSNNTNLGTRFEVIRTGTGDIEISTGRDVVLRNVFATIYTAGVGLADRNRIYQVGDFAIPITVRSTLNHPSQGGTLGAIQQNYAAYYAMAGGDLRVAAQGDIGRFTLYNGQIIPDASRQLPTNWLYRRGQIDPATGLFAVGGVTVSTGIGTVTDPSASTTWWVDYSNFFQGFGALGGGDIDLESGGDIINADAAIPTSARMAGVDPLTGQNIAPSLDNLQELGGGDLLVRAGGNVDGGSFFIERGTGRIEAGDEITTNSAQSPSRGILKTSVSQADEILDPLTWQAVTLYGGRSQFNVTARGNVLIGPATSAFFLPQGLNNKFWYKTQFQTIGEESGVTVASYGGAITHRLAVTLPGDTITLPTLVAAYNQTSALSPGSAGYYRPWLRIAENNGIQYQTIATVALPSLRSTAFGGSVSVIGSLNLFPSPLGELEIIASGGIIGLNKTGITRTTVNGADVDVTAWASASINLSDANPNSVPGITSPSGYQQVVGSQALSAVRDGTANPFGSVAPLFQETGAYTGIAGTVDVQTALHAPIPVHTNNPNPLRLYAGGGDITGLTLFSPKKVLAHAERDITDIAFYIQHVAPEDISIVSAGRDIAPFNENSSLRSLAGDVTKGNLVVDPLNSTVLFDASGLPITTQAKAGDIQIGGQGTMEILAGRNIDLGSGANFTDGTGIGFSSIGRSRNPFLPFEGADFVILAGVGGISGGPALGLMGSSLNFEDLLAGASSSGAVDATSEHRAVESLGELFLTLNQVAIAAAETGDYEAGYTAISEIFGSSATAGSLFTRARDIRTASGGAITIATPGGGITMASDIFGNPLTPPGIVTEYGGAVSILTEGNVDIGQARIFTLRGGDLTIWSSSGDIAAGTAPKTVVTAPPTRVLIDATSADIQTDLGGLATGGGIGVLAAVDGVEPGSVFLIAPEGTVDAGDAGIRATGDITIAAVSVINADNISAGGSTVGVPVTPTVAVPNIAGLSSASSSTGAANSAATQMADQARPQPTPEETPSIIAVEVLGYGGAGEG